MVLMPAAPFARRSDSESSLDFDRWDSQPPARGANGGPAVELVVLRRSSAEVLPCKVEGCDLGGGGQENQEQLPLPKAVARRLVATRMVSRRLEEDYRLEAKVLGIGVSGQVHSAVCRKTGRRVAVKSFDRLSMNRRQWEDVQNEVQIYMSLDHPNIAQLLQVYDEGTDMHVVMENLAGGELFSRVLACRRYTEAEAAGVAQQVLRAVAYLHAHNVVHGDVKLENVLYDHKDSQHVKLIDFGHAQRPAGGERMSRQCGTLQYVAPEVLAGSYTAKADLWSVGVLLYTTLLGRHLYNGSPKAVRSKVAAGRPDYAQGLRQLSEGAQSLVRALLEVDPSKRISASEALRHPWLCSCTSRAPVADNSVMRSLGAFPKTSRALQENLLAEAWALPNEVQAPLRQQFLALDGDGDGAISLDDLSHAFGPELGARAGQVFSALDINGDGEVTWSEYVAATMPKTTHSSKHGRAAHSVARPSLLGSAAKWEQSVQRIAQVTQFTMHEVFVGCGS